MSDIATRRIFAPKLLTMLGKGYGWADARADLFAGLTVSVVALPLSLALAIASGVSPGRGLFTAVIAGAIVSSVKLKFTGGETLPARSVALS